MGILLFKKLKLGKQITTEKTEKFKYKYKYKNLVFLFISVIIASFILKFRPLTPLISDLNYLGYLAAFILGMLFTYTLTVAPATTALYNLGGILNPFLVASIGAVGSVISDYLIFRFVRDKLMDEIKELSEEINKFTKPVSNLIIPENTRIVIWHGIAHSRIWKTLIPIIAGLIIASPLPDELGVAIFGAAKYEPKKFIIYSYLLNFIGILVITSLSTYF